MEVMEIPLIYPSENGNAGGNGGGLVIFNSIEIINCQISNNKAGNGGNGGKTYIDSDNNPSTKPGTGGNAGSGGGIYVYYDNSKSAYTMTMTISSSTLDNNSAGTGGAGGIDDKDGSHSSNGGNGGNGGAVAIISAKIANPANYNLHLYLERAPLPIIKPASAVNLILPVPEELMELVEVYTPMITTTSPLISTVL